MTNARTTKVGKRHPCPRCGARDVAAILWGYPSYSEQLERDERAGELFIGGCMPGPSRYRCNACRTEFGKFGEIGELGALGEEPSDPIR
jgi:DNA-directed RNA polymerase subunit RPC12/RpoP